MSPPGTNPAELSRNAKPITGERRRRVRHRVHTPAYVGLNTSPMAVALDLSEVVDISEAGVCIQTMAPLQVNRTLNLCLDLSEAKTRINATGLVIWSDSGRTGIRFLEMPDASLLSLREWLFLNALTGCDQAPSQTSRPRPELSQAQFGNATSLSAVAELPAQLQATPVLPDDPKTLAAPATVWGSVEAAAGSHLERFLQAIVERALVSTRATGAAIAIARSGEMVCVARAGSDAPALGARLQAGSGFSGECVRSRKLLRCDDAESDERVDRETCRLLGIRSMAAAPIRSGDAVVGLLEVFSPIERAFSGVADAAFEHFAEEVSVALSRSAGSSVTRGKPPETPATVKQSASAPITVPDRKPAGAIKATFLEQPPVARSRKPILVAAAAALVIAALSLIVPRIRNGTSVSEQPNPEPHTKPQMPVSRPPMPTVANANNLAGLRQLAEQGDPAAQFAVGARFATGEEVKQDYTEAVRWFSMAAEQGHIVAQATLGAYYWAGRGVPQDLTKAYYWSILAQAGGDQASKYRVAVLTSRMTRSQVLAAQQEANDWLTHHQLSSKPSPQIR